MASRGTNRVQALRWSAAALLVGAGTLAVLVVAERRSAAPESNASLSPRAEREAERIERAPIRAMAKDEAPPFEHPAVDPDLWNDPAVPPLVAAGGVEEARREDVVRRGIPAPQATGQVPERRQGITDGAGRSLDLTISDIPWPTAPAARSLNDITVYEPTRTAATLQLTPLLEVTGGKTGFGSGDLPSIGSIETADGSRTRGEADLYDFSVRLNALAGVPSERPLDLGVIGGLRSASLFDPSLRDMKMSEPIPVVGGDARLKWSERSMLRASAVGEAPGTVRDYLDLRLEQVWRIGGDASLSLGWRHLRGILSNDQPEPVLKQDAILLELKIGF